MFCASQNTQYPSDPFALHWGRGAATSPVTEYGKRHHRLTQEDVNVACVDHIYRQRPGKRMVEAGHAENRPIFNAINGSCMAFGRSIRYRTMGSAGVKMGDAYEIVECGTGRSEERLSMQCRLIERR